MNELFSRSLRQYSDVEAGGGSNLDKFFEDVEEVKTEIKGAKKLYKQLEESNEQSKMAHNAKTVKEVRARMGRDVEQVLETVKFIKGQLGALERSNASSSNVPGCGPGSSADRTRTGVVSGLGKKLKDLMDDFQGLGSRMQQEYKETVERRYFTITGEKADESTINNLVASGANEKLVQKAIQEQGRGGEILDTISELQERHETVKEIEKKLIEVQQVFLEMAALVESQGQHLNSIEMKIAHARSLFRWGTKKLQFDRQHQKNSRKWTCIALILGLLLIFAIVVPLLVMFFPHLVR